jgi:hypothetical protein
MIACAFTAAPKLSPPAGMPPITPGSAVSVIRSSTPSPRGHRGDALGHADAEVDHGIWRQLQRGAAGDHLARARGQGAMRSSGTRISPAKAGL